MTSAEYTSAYNEAKRLGGDGIVTPTERTAEQTGNRLFSGITMGRQAYAHRTIVQPDRRSDSGTETYRLML